MNCKQLFAMIMLSLHFNMAFLGIPAVLSQGCALSGDLCLRTEHLLFAEGVLIIAVLFYSVTQLRLSPERDPGSMTPSSLPELVLFCGGFEICSKNPCSNKQNAKT